MRSAPLGTSRTANTTLSLDCVLTPFSPLPTAIFAKLNAADVRAKEQLLARASKDADRSRKTSRLAEPLVFEISARAEHGTAPASLPAKLVARLQIKTRKAAAKPLTTLVTRLAISKSARVAFALKNLVSAHVAFAARMRRARALKAAVFGRASAGAALARHHTHSVANTAKRFNSRVSAAAARRAASDASRNKAAARRSLRAVAVAGRRATRLLDASVNIAETNRAEIFFAKREAVDAARLSREQSGLIRSLVVAMKGSELLLHKAARAHMASLPYGTPAKLTKAGGVLFKRYPETYARVAIHLSNQPGAARAELSITVAFPAGGEGSSGGGEGGGGQGCGRAGCETSGKTSGGASGVAGYGAGGCAGPGGSRGRAGPRRPHQSAERGPGGQDGRYFGLHRHGATRDARPRNDVALVRRLRGLADG